MPNAHTSTMETSERQTTFLKRGEQLSFSNAPPADTENYKQDDDVHESSDHEMNSIDSFQSNAVAAESESQEDETNVLKHVQTHQTVDDTLVFLPGEEDDIKIMSEDETTRNSSPTSTIREYFRRVACPSIPTSNHSDSTPPEDSERGLVKRMLRRSLAWSQDSDDTETRFWKRRKDNPSSESATALWHLPASSHGDTSPTCVHWEEKLTDMYGLTSAAQESDDA